MFIERLPLGIYAANCYIVMCEDTKEAMIVDLGGEAEEIIKKSKELGFKVNSIVLTHGHGDHIAGVPDLLKVVNCPVYIHEKDEEMLLDPKLNLTAVMSTGETIIKPDRLLKDGDIINIGNLKTEVIHTPGHTPGGISLKVENYLITGDTLFKGSIGRTDLYGGSYDAILDSVNSKLLVYSDDIIILPGHGPATKVGLEKATNPFARR
ncbi:MAG: MBL fold metallo-hydrolase [Tissierellales bacterium]